MDGTFNAIVQFLLTSPWISRGTLAMLAVGGGFGCYKLAAFMLKETFDSIKAEYKKRANQIDELSKISGQVYSQVNVGVNNHLDHAEKSLAAIEQSNIVAAQTLAIMNTKQDAQHEEMIRILTDIRDEFRSNKSRPIVN